MMAPIPRDSVKLPFELGEYHLNIRAPAGRAQILPIKKGESITLGSAATAKIRVIGELPLEIGSFHCVDNRLTFASSLDSKELADLVRCNDQVLTIGSQETGAGDRWQIAGIEIQISRPAVLLQPAFHAFDLPVNNHHFTPEIYQDSLSGAQAERESSSSGRVEASHQDLQRWQQNLHEQQQLLQQEQAEFARQKQEFQKNQEEWFRLRPHPDVIRNEQDLETAFRLRQAELDETRAELANIRQSLYHEYREKREQLAQLQEIILEASETLKAREEDFEAQLARRQDALEESYNRKRIELDLEHQEKLLVLQEDASHRREQFEASLHENWQENSRPSPNGHDHQIVLKQLQESESRLQASRAELHQERDALLQEREQWQEQRDLADSLLKAREQEVARKETWAQEERERLAHQRDALSQDLLLVERRHSEIEELDEIIKREQAGMQLKREHLERDAAELEENVRQFAEEQAALQQQAGFLQSWRQELQERQEALEQKETEHAAAHAALVMMRAQLDRQKEQASQEAQLILQERVRLEEQQRFLELNLRHHGTAVRDAHQEHSFDQTWSEINAVRQAQQEEASRLQAWSHELDQRYLDLTEQLATIKTRAQQLQDSRHHLELDRASLVEQQQQLAEADAIRQKFQQQLHQRSEELSQQRRELDEAQRLLASQGAELEHQRSQWAEQELQLKTQQQEHLVQLEAREAQVLSRERTLEERLSHLTRQIHRLQETGRSLATTRKNIFVSRRQLQTEKAALESLRNEIDLRTGELRKVAPDLEGRAGLALQKLGEARQMIRTQLNELHHYAQESQASLEKLRHDVQQEMERLNQRHSQFETARLDHRRAVSAFRQEILEWQKKIDELKKQLNEQQRNDTSPPKELPDRAPTKDNSEPLILSPSALQQQTWQAQWQQEQDRLTDRRTAVERHLADMRRWYRKKLRELAGNDQGEVHEFVDHTWQDLVDEELDPGDRQLGTLLMRMELIDQATLHRLWEEAHKQRRTLRQVLLMNKTITLFQLALIEAGNIDALMLDRFRVVDRIKVTPQEAIFRVIDPTLPELDQHSGCWLRLLGDAELHDATRPDEYLSRFRSLWQFRHPGIFQIYDVLTINDRPAVLQEIPRGIPEPDWQNEGPIPVPVALHLSCQLIDLFTAADDQGLTHGTLSGEAVFLQADGTLRVQGLAEPSWLKPSIQVHRQTLSADDLVALQKLLAGWFSAERRSPRRQDHDDEQLLTRLRLTPHSPPFSSFRDIKEHFDIARRHDPVEPSELSKFLAQVYGDQGDNVALILKKSA